MYHIAYLTAPTKASANRIAKALVDEKFCACAHVLGPVESFFRWNGKQEHAKEYIVIAKTVKRLFHALKKRVLELHPYDCPCILSLKIGDGNREYLEWISSSVC